jgi:putative glutamine amidotransferase
LPSIIGITANYDEGEKNYYLRDAYVSAIQKAGGTALILPPSEDDALIDSYMGICRGFILSGGGDIDPFHWGEMPEWALGEINPLRDHFELALARKILEKNLPLLGICRGCQLLNVAAGGTLMQDIDSCLSHEQKAPRSYPFHAIFIKKGSLLSRIVNKRQIRVNSFHHQAVKKTAACLRVSACASDGTVEAIEALQGFALGVQWHPEYLLEDHAHSLFRALVKASLKQI